MPSRVRFKTLTERVVYAHRPCHPLLSLNSREHFGGVLESDWSFTQRVADGEEVDEPGGGRSLVGLRIAHIFKDLQDHWSNLCALAARGLEERQATS